MKEPTAPQLLDLRAGRSVELRHPFDDSNPLPYEPGQTWKLREDFWLELRGWWTDDETEEYVYKVRKAATPDAPRLLMPAGRRPSRTEIGYTSVPAFAMGGNADPGEAVDEATQQRITKDGWSGYNARERQRLVDRRLLAIEERLKLAWGDGQRLRIDLSSSLKAVERIVAGMERKTDQTKDAA